MPNSWMLFKIWSKDLETLFDDHKASDYQLLTKLQIGDEVLQILQLSNYNTPGIDDYFTLVEVTDVKPCSSVLNVKGEGEELIVKAIEPRLAENCCVVLKPKYNLIFKDEFAHFLKDKIKPRDIIITKNCRISYDMELEEFFITFSTSPTSPSVVVVFRPYSNDDSAMMEDYVINLSQLHPTLIYEYFNVEDIDLIRVCPESWFETNITNGESDICSETSDCDDPLDAAVVTNNVVDPNSEDDGYEWVKVPFIEDDNNASESENSTDEDLTDFPNLSDSEDCTIEPPDERNNGIVEEMEQEDRDLLDNVASLERNYHDNAHEKQNYHTNGSNHPSNSHQKDSSENNEIVDGSDSVSENVSSSMLNQSLFSISLNPDKEVDTPDFINRTLITNINNGKNHRKRNYSNSTFETFLEGCAKYQEDKEYNKSKKDKTAPLQNGSNST